MNKPVFKEGTWFAMPLHGGGYAAGIVARRAPRGVVLLTYLFGPRLETIPNLADLEQLQVKDAIKCIRVGYLGLNTGEWIIIGDHKNWRREDWPMANFLGYTQHGPSWLVVYSDKNPNKVERHDPLPADITGLEAPTLYGHIAAEIMMTNFFNQT